MKELTTNDQAQSESKEKGPTQGKNIKRKFLTQRKYNKKRNSHAGEKHLKSSSYPKEQAWD